MRILIVLSADPLAHAGGVPEFDGLIEAYYLFCDAGADVVVAASGGGSASEVSTPSGVNALQRFRSDRAARDVMNDLVDLAAVCAADFDGAICLGSKDLPGEAGDLVVRLLAAGKPVAVMAPLQVDAYPGTSNGVLIVGKSAGTLRLAANALLGAVRVH